MQLSGVLDVDSTGDMADCRQGGISDVHRLLVLIADVKPIVNLTTVELATLNLHGKLDVGAGTGLRRLLFAGDNHNGVLTGGDRFGCNVGLNACCIEIKSDHWIFAFGLGSGFRFSGLLDDIGILPIFVQVVIQALMPEAVILLIILPRCGSSTALSAPDLSLAANMKSGWVRRYRYEFGPDPSMPR